MAKAAYLQSSFLGGEWSPYAQGRMDDPQYRTGLNVCRNAIPIEEGAWVRRPGTRLCGNTRKGLPAKLESFHFTQAAPYNMEFTDGKLRFFSGPNLVVEAETQAVISVSGAEPAVITTGEAHTWVDGNAVQFYVESGEDIAGITRLLNRVFEINALTATTFSIADQVTGEAFDGAGLSFNGVVLGVARVLELDTPYVDGSWADVNIVQDERQVLLLHPDYQPRLIQGGVDTGVEGVFRTFTIAAAAFEDGPYLDVIDDGSYLTPSGTTGSITLTQTNFGDGPAFQTTDVGRLVRLYSRPLNWANATSYTAGDSVTYLDNFWTALTDNSGKKPDISLDDWALDPGAALWTWARITARSTDDIVTALVLGEDLLTTNRIVDYRLGVFSDTDGWPSAGGRHEGRLCLAGPVKNRFDCSMNNEFLRFSPTEGDGTVADNNAIAALVQGNPGVNTVLWFVSDDQGLLVGTQAGEWLVRASQTNDPLSPTSIQVKQMTNHGSANVQPVRAGMSTLFVHRFERKVLEYTAYGEARFGANNLSRNGKHLSKSGIAEIALQKELVPCVWARMVDGTLAGCTYQRDNPVGTQPATFAGWHRHDFGHERFLTSLSSGPSEDGTLDSVMLVTRDADGVHYVEILTKLFDQDTPISESWHVDGGLIPNIGELVGDNLTLYGLDAWEGELVDVWAAGVDAGSFTVTNGQIVVPVNATGSLLTTALLQSVSAEASTLAAHTRFASGTPGVIDAGGVLRYTRTDTNVTGLQGLSNAIIPDWGRNRLVTSTEGSVTSGVDGLRRFNLTTGTEEEDVNVTDLLSVGQEITAPWALDSRGYLYWGCSNPGYSQYASYDPSDFSTPVANFLGTANASYAAGRIATPTALVTSEAGSAVYLFAASSVHGEWVSGRGIYVMDWSDPAAATLLGNPGFAIAENGGGLAKGPGAVVRGVPIATAYLLGYRQGGVAVSITPFPTLYQIAVVGGEVGGGAIGTVTPGSIEAGWTHFTAIGFGLYDETDGNVIGSFASADPDAWDSGDDYIASQFPVVRAPDGHDYLAIDDSGPGTPNSAQDPDEAGAPTYWLDLGVGAVDNNYYIAKINTQTAAVMWAVPVNDMPVGEDLRMSRCQEGTYAFYSNVSTSANTYPLYVIDTSDGSSSIISVKNISNLREVQAFNDKRARVIFRGSTDTTLTGDPGEPAPVAPTPATFSEDICSLDGEVGTFAYASYLTPIFVGKSYTSQGQILRPIAPQEAGTKLGPAFGNTRRSHMFACLLHRTQGISFGTDFDKLRPAEFKTPGGTLYANNVLFSGTVQTTIEDDYSFDSMIAWQIDRPYPATVLTVGAFVQTQDR